MDAVKGVEALTLLTGWSPVALGSLCMVYLGQKWMDRRPDIIKGNGESWDRLAGRIVLLEQRLNDVERENRELRLHNLALQAALIAQGVPLPAMDAVR